MKVMKPNFEAEVDGIQYKSFGNTGHGLKLENWTESKYLGVPEYDAICTISSLPVPVNLGVVFEIMDLAEILEPYDHEYSFCVEASIVVLSPISDEFLASAATSSGWEPDGGWTPEQKAMCCFDYAGGIPVFLDSVQGAGNKQHESDFAEQKCAWFTGPRGNKYMRFRDLETAEAWLNDVYAPNMRAIFGIVGFFLDRPINRMGTTGWNIIELWTRNKNPYR